MTHPAESTLYQTAYLDLKLAQDTTAGLIAWQQAYEQALANWELERCRQLLALVRRVSLNQQQRGAVLHLEGMFWEQWGDWSTASRVLERAVSIQREAEYARGEMVALNSLANVLRRDEKRHHEAISLYHQALEIATELKDDQARAGILNNLGLAQYGTGDLEASQVTLDQALELAQQQNDRQREGRALHNLGSLAWSQGRLNDAEQFFSAALEICREQHDRVGEAETLSSLGITWEAQGLWTEAENAYRQTLVVLQEIGDHHGQTYALINLGNVAELQERHEEAIHYYHSGFSLARSLGDAHLEGTLLGGLADVYKALGQFDEAQETYRLALARKTAAGDQRSQPITLMALGGLYHKLKQLDQAESTYQQAIQLAQATNNQRILVHAYINLAKLAMLRAQADLAYPHLDQAEALAREMNYHEALSDVAQLRGDILLSLGPADGRQISFHYTEALIHAADFNQMELSKRLDYLAGLLQAIAADGDLEGAKAVCEGILFLWGEADLDERCPQVPEFFTKLRSRLAST
ncbi:MAG: tetratricopeptide repeat protein [Anaerolineae bacterium]|nr:tetratricopeptide repeat protein [Anaerolineae bacterium]